MESENESKTSNDIKTHPAASHNEEDHSTPDIKLTSSSSSSTSSSEDFFRLDANGSSRLSVEDTTGDPNHDEDDLNYDHAFSGNEALSEDLGRDSSDSSSDDDSVKQCPPTQVMDRTGDSEASTPYRLPSYVFDRNKSTAPMEWSVASNESLFSIHMGNMSFTKDYASWMKPEELEKIPSDGYYFDDLDSPNTPNTPTEVSNESSDVEHKSDDEDKAFGVSESEAAEFMRDVIRANEEDASKEQQQALNEKSNSINLSRLSNESGTSVKSFAFQLLGGEPDRSGSMKGGTEKRKKQQHAPSQSQPETPKVSPLPPSSEPETPRPQTSKENQNDNGNDNVNSNSNGNASQTKWFSCLPCCTNCS